MGSNPLGTRVGLNGLIIGGGGLFSLRLSFFASTMTVITPIPIKLYNSMYLPKEIHELILDYKFSMEQHNRHKKVLISLKTFFLYVKYRSFVKFRWPKNSMQIQVYQRFLEVFDDFSVQ